MESVPAPSGAIATMDSDAPLLVSSAGPSLDPAPADSLLQPDQRETVKQQPQPHESGQDGQCFSLAAGPNANADAAADAVAATAAAADAACCPAAKVAIHSGDTLRFEGHDGIVAVRYTVERDAISVHDMLRAAVGNASETRYTAWLPGAVDRMRAVGWHFATTNLGKGKSTPTVSPTLAKAFLDTAARAVFVGRERMMAAVVAYCESTHLKCLLECLVAHGFEQRCPRTDELGPARPLCRVGPRQRSPHGAARAAASDDSHASGSATDGEDGGGSHGAVAPSAETHTKKRKVAEVHRADAGVKKKQRQARAGFKVLHQAGGLATDVLGTQQQRLLPVGSQPMSHGERAPLSGVSLPVPRPDRHAPGRATAEPMDEAARRAPAGLCDTGIRSPGAKKHNDVSSSRSEYGAIAGNARPHGEPSTSDGSTMEPREDREEEEEHDLGVVVAFAHACATANADVLVWHHAGGTWSGLFWARPVTAPLGSVRWRVLASVLPCADAGRTPHRADQYGANAAGAATGDVMAPLPMYLGVGSPPPSSAAQHLPPALGGIGQATTRYGDGLGGWVPLAAACWTENERLVRLLLGFAKRPGHHIVAEATARHAGDTHGAMCRDARWHAMPAPPEVATLMAPRAGETADQLDDGLARPVCVMDLWLARVGAERALRSRDDSFRKHIRDRVRWLYALSLGGLHEGPLMELLIALTTTDATYRASLYARGERQRRHPCPVRPDAQTARRAKQPPQGFARAGKARAAAPAVAATPQHD